MEGEQCFWKLFGSNSGGSSFRFGSSLRRISATSFLIISSSITRTLIDHRLISPRSCYELFRCFVFFFFFLCPYFSFTHHTNTMPCFCLSVPTSPCHYKHPTFPVHFHFFRMRERERSCEFSNCLQYSAIFRRILCHFWFHFLGSSVHCSSVPLSFSHFLLSSSFDFRMSPREFCLIAAHLDDIRFYDTN